MKSIYSLFFVTLLIACSGFNYGPVGQAAIEINQLSTSSGIVILEQYSGRVLVKGRIRGLKPFDQYTFNLHDESNIKNSDLPIKLTGQSNCAIIQEKIIPIQIRADEQFAFTMNTSKVVYAN